MPGRGYDPTRVNNALTQRFEALSDYRRRMIEEGSTRLTETLDSLSESEVFMPEVEDTSTRTQELLDFAAQQARTRPGSSLQASLQAQRRSRQFVLQALENPEATRKALSSFYNPITGKRENISEGDPSRFFTTSLPEFENRLRNDLRQNIQTQMEPFVSQFDEDRTRIQAELNQLYQQDGSSRRTAQIQALERQMNDINREQSGILSGILKDAFGVEFDFTDLEGRDARALRDMTGFSPTEYLARTQEELIDIFGEERGQEEMEQRRLLSDRFIANREMAQRQATSANQANKEIAQQNLQQMEEAEQLRRKAANQEQEIQRSRRKTFDFGTGLSLDFGERPL